MKNDLEVKNSMIKELYNLSGTLYYHKFLNFNYRHSQVNDIIKDIELLKNKINNL